MSCANCLASRRADAGSGAGRAANYVGHRFGLVEQSPLQHTRMMVGPAPPRYSGLRWSFALAHRLSKIPVAHYILLKSLRSSAWQSWRELPTQPTTARMVDEGGSRSAQSRRNDQHQYATTRLMLCWNEIGQHAGEYPSRSAGLAVPGPWRAAAQSSRPVITYVIYLPSSSQLANGSSAYFDDVRGHRLTAHYRNAHNHLFATKPSVKYQLSWVFCRRFAGTV